MRKLLLSKLVSLIISLLTPELLKSFVDVFLDWIEDFVAGTKSPVDDAVILPLCNMIRGAFDIPDGDDAIEGVAPNKDPDSDE